MEKQHTAVWGSIDTYEGSGSDASELSEFGLSDRLFRRFVLRDSELSGLSVRFRLRRSALWVSAEADLATRDEPLP